MTDIKPYENFYGRRAHGLKQKIKRHDYCHNNALFIASMEAVELTHSASTAGVGGKFPAPTGKSEASGYPPPQLQLEVAAAIWKRVGPGQNNVLD